jgi:hypothetical protein
MLSVVARLLILIDEVLTWDLPVNVRIEWKRVSATNTVGYHFSVSRLNPILHHSPLEFNLNKNIAFEL